MRRDSSVGAAGDMMVQDTDNGARAREEQQSLREVAWRWAEGHCELVERSRRYFQEGSHFMRSSIEQQMAGHDGVIWGIGFALGQEWYATEPSAWLVEEWRRQEVQL